MEVKFLIYNKFTDSRDKNDNNSFIERFGIFKLSDINKEGVDNLYLIVNVDVNNFKIGDKIKLYNYLNMVITEKTFNVHANMFEYVLIEDYELDSVIPRREEGIDTVDG